MDIDEQFGKHPESDKPEEVAALIAAIQEARLDAVRKILDSDPGLVSEVAPKQGWDGPVPMIHFAIDSGNTDIVKLLLNSGVDIDKATHYTDWKPIHLAAHCSVDMAKFLEQHGAHVDIFAASMLGDVDRLRQLLKEEPSRVAEKGPDGATALHFAGGREVAEVLIGAGADLEVADEFHQCTPLAWMAGEHKSSGAISCLRENGAKVDIFVASAIGDLEEVKKLLATDESSVNAVTPERHVLEAGASPLHEAAFFGHLDIVNLLLEHGADLSIKDASHGATPLGWAEYGKQGVIVSRLKEAGAI